MTAVDGPAYLLIHGGAVTGRFWDRLVPELDGPSLVIDLPGRADRPADLKTVTVADGVASIHRDLAQTDRFDLADRSLVIVAHSSGGLYVPGLLAAIQDDVHVEKVVLSAASVPPEGGCGLDCMKARHRDLLVAAVEDARSRGDMILAPGPTGDPEALRDAYGERLDDETLAFMADPVRNVPDSVNVYYSPIHWSAVDDLPVVYVRGSLDRPVPPTLQDEMIGHLRDPEVVRLDVGHIPPVTQPTRFAAIVHGETTS